MDLTSIMEATISGVFSTLISMAIIFLISKIWGKQGRKIHSNHDKIVSTSYVKNPFLISLFFTIFVFVLTFFSFLFSWEMVNYVYLVIVAFILTVITYLIYDNQCPSCNSIFTKKLVNKETLKEEKRPYRYRDLTIYLYSDGSEKDRRYTGKEKTIMETWRTEKEFYECKKCYHKWDKVFERNLDFDNRPKPNIITTKIRSPDIYYL